jgi:DNA polymerase-3 subunit epsilon
VGIVVVRNGIVADRFYELIKPNPGHYDYWNTRVHGLTETDTAFAAPFPVVWERVARIVENLPLVAHNSPFDERCLRSAHLHYSMPYPDYNFMCTCRMSRRAFPGLPNHKLHTVAAHIGFDLRNHHHALADAEACAAIALAIIG